jgi:RNA polymerase sigma-70 factor (ECF subfamily)
MKRNQNDWNERALIAGWQLSLSREDNLYVYSQLCTFFSRRLHRFACQYVKSRELADEIVSDVLLKLWQIRRKLKGVEDLPVYLFIMTKNRSLRCLEQQERNAFRQVALNGMEEYPESGDPESICISGDTLKQIHAALEELPPRCRRIFRLVKEDGRPYREVALMMQISEITVRNQLAIAVRKLGKRLAYPVLR